MGVNDSIDIVRNIESLFINKEYSSLEEFEKDLLSNFGEYSERKIGGNITLSLSIAMAKGFAAEENRPLYEIFGNSFQIPKLSFYRAIGGGILTNQFSKSAFQEYALVPNTKSNKEGYLIAYKIQEKLKVLLAEKGKVTYSSLSGALQTNLFSDKYFLTLLTTAIDQCEISYDKIGIYIDAAANSFFRDDAYWIESDCKVSRADISSYYLEMLEQFPLIYYLEDPFHEDDISNWSKLKCAYSGTCQIIGDDLYSTQADQILKNHDLCDGMIVKPNQVGTFFEAKSACHVAKKKGLKTIISDRSGEIPDPYLVNFGIGSGIDAGKYGSLFYGGCVFLNEVIRHEEVEHEV